MPDSAIKPGIAERGDERRSEPSADATVAIARAVAQPPFEVAGTDDPIALLLVRLRPAGSVNHNTRGPCMLPRELR